MSAHRTSTSSHGFWVELSSPPTYWMGFCTDGSSGSRRGNTDPVGTVGTGLGDGTARTLQLGGKGLPRVRRRSTPPLRRLCFPPRGLCFPSRRLCFRRDGSSFRSVGGRYGAVWNLRP